MAEFFQIVRDRLAAQAGSKPAGDHISTDLLVAFQEWRLTSNERVRVMEHLAACGSCREVLALANPPLGASAAQVVQRNWLRAPILRWGTVAAAFATVVVAVAIHQHRPASEVVPVAVSRAMPEPQLAVPPAAERAPVAADQPAARGFSANAKALAVAPKKKQESGSRVASKLAQTGGVATISESVTVVEHEEFRAQGLNAAPTETVSVTAESAPIPSAPPPPPSSSALPLSSAMSRALPVLTIRSAGTGAAVMQDAPAPSAEPNAPSEAPIFGGNASRSSSETIYLRKALDLAKRRVVGIPTVRPGSSGAVVGNAAPAPLASSAPWGSSVLWRRQTVTVTGTAWNITQSGRLQRSVDGGRTWQLMLPDTSSKFRVMCTAGDSIWVGSQDGVLFRSNDNGDHWVRIGSPWDRGSVSATILSIDFSDALHGLLLASNGDTWETFDGGNTWMRH